MHRYIDGEYILAVCVNVPPFVYFVYFCNEKKSRPDSYVYVCGSSGEVARETRKMCRFAATTDCVTSYGVVSGVIERYFSTGD